MKQTFQAKKFLAAAYQSIWEVAALSVPVILGVGAIIPPDHRKPDLGTLVITIFVAILAYRNTSGRYQYGKIVPSKRSHDILITWILVAALLVCSVVWLLINRNHLDNWTHLLPAWIAAVAILLVRPRYDFK